MKDIDIDIDTDTTDTIDIDLTSDAKEKDGSEDTINVADIDTAEEQDVGEDIIDIYMNLKTDNYFFNLTISLTIFFFSKKFKMWFMFI